MITPGKVYGRIVLQLRGRVHVEGWSMSPGEVIAFIRSHRKTVLTLIGFSADYEDVKQVLEKIKGVLASYSPDKTLINIGATKGGIGAAYPLAKSMGFLTTGIVSTEALANWYDISEDVDHICFIRDRLWGGYLPGTGDLSPTSRAIVNSSDVMIGFGGNDIARDELIVGRKLGIPVRFFPAEMNHEGAIRQARQSGKPPPTSFFGSAHEVFGKDQPISTSSSQIQR